MDTTAISTRLGVALWLASCLSGACSRDQRAETDAETDPYDASDDRGDVSQQEESQSGDDDAGTDGALDCASVEERAELRTQPVDILFVVDNSGSMSDEIEAIEERINRDFAAIIAASGVDYRVLMVSRYGDGHEQVGHAVCVDPPLSARACDGEPEKKVANGERFFHFSAAVDSLDAWCVLLESLDAPDDYNHAIEVGSPYFEPRDWESTSPKGLREHLRAEAFKQIVIISDDSMLCYSTQAYADLDGNVRTLGDEWNPEVLQHPEFFFGAEPDIAEYLEGRGIDVTALSGDLSAKRFDRALTSRAREHFGTPEQRNYRVHSIVDITGDRALTPDEPVVTTCAEPDPDTGRCRPGLPHQTLSILTGGLRYPISRHANYDEIFDAVAKDTIQRAQLSCAWTIPPSRTGEPLDPSKVNLKYSSSDGESRIIPKDAACTREGWRYDDDDAPTRIEACPATCDLLRSDTGGAIDISFGCTTIVVL